MKWLVFDTEHEARGYSHQEAINKGVGNPDDVCQYWWEVRETTTGKWAVHCPEGTNVPSLKEFTNDENN